MKLTAKLDNRSGVKEETEVGVSLHICLSHKYLNFLPLVSSTWGIPHHCYETVGNKREQCSKCFVHDAKSCKKETPPPILSEVPHALEISWNKAVYIMKVTFNDISHFREL